MIHLNKLIKINAILIILLYLTSCGDRDYELTISIQGNGSVEVDDVKYTHDTVITYEIDKLVSLEAIADNGWDFSQWQGSITSESNSTTISMTEDKEVTAIFLENNAVIKGTIKYEDELISNITMYATNQLASISTGAPYTGSVIGTSYITDSNGYYELKIPFDTSVTSRNIYIFALRNGHLIYNSEQLTLEKHQVLSEKNIILTNYLPKLKIEINGPGYLFVNSPDKIIKIFSNTTLVYNTGTKLLFIASEEPNCITLSKWSIETEGTVIESFDQNFEINRDTTLKLTFIEADESEFVFNTMKKNYFFYEDKDVQYTNTTSASFLFSELKSSSDNTSYITYDESENYTINYEKYPVYGFIPKFYNNILYVKFVFPNSYAAQIGLNRGDKINKINKTITSNLDENDIYSIFSNTNNIELAVEKNGLTNTYQILPNDDWINFNPILKHSIIETNNPDLKIGYLAIESFNEVTNSNLDSIFKNFKDNSINELILDLRYNKRGSVFETKYIAELIGIPDSYSKTYVNMNYREKDEPLSFESEQSNALNITRVFFITSESTSYASEALINALKPYLEIIVIGSKTKGNPWGIQEYGLCDIHLNIVEYMISNSEGNSYTIGIEVDCNAVDDVTIPFGDNLDPAIENILYFIENEACITN